MKCLPWWAFFIFALSAYGNIHDDSSCIEVVLTDSNYSNIYHNQYVAAIRLYFNLYLVEQKNCCSLSEGSTGKPYIFRNDSVYSDYYADSFSIIHVWPGDFGGMRGDIIFKKRRDRIFRFWVYRIDSNEYQLKSIDDMNISEKEIDYIVKTYGEILFKQSL